MKKKYLIFLAIALAGVIRATEVYVCDWEEEVYSCTLLSQEEKKPLEPEEPLIFEPPMQEEISVYDY